MNWSKASAAAAAIAQAWTREGGPGGAILLFDADNIRAEAFGGRASLELDIPFRADTATRYASISKQFFTALLVQDGRIGLDDPLGKHIELPPALAAVPVARALDMTGGIPDVVDTMSLLGAPSTATLDRHALLRFVRMLPGLNFTPGTEISYSNTGYRILQAALDAKGTEYGAALRERFAVPLGLTISLPEDETDPVANLATGYWRGPRGWQRGRYGLHISASGGLTGSALDLVAWGQALMAGRGPAAGLLARLGARRTLADGRATAYGLGLARSVLPGEIVIGHGGSLPGYKNHLLLAPEHNVGVVALSNREDTDAHGITLQVLAALFEVALPEPATDLLAQGEFVADEGPFWMAHQSEKLTWFGAEETLYAGADGFAESHSAHMPIRLKASGDTIVGEIGHAARRFRRLEPGLAAQASWAGRWVCPAQHAELDIAVSGGVARLGIGMGPLYDLVALKPIAADRAVLERAGEGPGRRRAVLQFSRDELLLASTRSRVLRFRRG
jgi:CubicO group peptidase (beta-lactamase class C family)